MTAWKTIGTVTGRMSSGPSLPEVREPLVDEAKRALMIPFLDACRDAGYHLICVDRDDTLIRACWREAEPLVVGLPAIWLLVARHVGAIGPAHENDRHCIYTAGPHWLVPGMYELAKEAP